MFVSSLHLQTPFSFSVPPLPKKHVLVKQSSSFEHSSPSCPSVERSTHTGKPSTKVGRSEHMGLFLLLHPALVWGWHRQVPPPNPRVTKQRFVEQSASVSHESPSSLDVAVVTNPAQTKSNTTSFVSAVIIIVIGVVMCAASVNVALLLRFMS